MSHRIALILVAGLLLAADWPGWRGPTGQGHTVEKDLPLTWSGKDGTNVLWKAPLPGTKTKARQDQNQSSPIVNKGHVFATASFWPDGADPKGYPEHHVVCYRVGDGAILWDTKVPPGPWKLSDLRGGYTAPTPSSDGERVIVLFGSSVLAAVDFRGALLWRKEVVPFQFDVALGASPVLHGDLVLLQCDQVNRQSRLMAFDKKSGALQWERKRPESGFSHSTPVLARIGGQLQLLMAASNAIQGVDPQNGDLLWWCAAHGDTVSPVYGGGVVYCDSGRGGPGVAADPTGHGDLTKTHLRWQVANVPEGFSSPVIVDEYLYRAHNPGIVKCWRLATGVEVFAERLAGMSTSASPIATADGRLYFACAGKSFVLKAGTRPKILAVNELGDGSPASPAVADGRLFLKGRQFLYCISAASR